MTAISTDVSFQKAFFKKNFRGNVVRSVQNSFLRNDLEMGSMHSVTLSLSALQELIAANNNAPVIVIDTNIALHHIDLLEFQSSATCLVVISQTVLSELRNLNLSVQKRILSLIKDTKRNFILFTNEVCLDTMHKRKRQESSNDFNDRLIVNVALYYQKLMSSGTVAFVTNDAANRENALAAGLTCYDIKSYIDLYSSDCPRLLDFIAPDSQLTDSTIPNMYTPHVSNDTITKGLRTGQYHRGILRTKATSWEDCYVVIHDDLDHTRKYVYIHGKENVNRAVEGDVVAVEIISNSSVQEAVLSSGTMEEPSFQDIEGLGSNTPSYVGKVVGIIRRNFKQYSGSIDISLLSKDYIENNNNSNESNEVVINFVPLDKKIPCITIATRRMTEIVDARLLVVIDSWPPNTLYPLGHLVSVLGKKGDKEVETKILLNEFGVTSEDFTPQVMSCLPSKDWCITEDIIAQRLDLRSIPIVSIDPPGCKDIDDALHCIPLANGRLQVGVHIADVSHFVHPDTPLDLEASHRSTSTYLVERRLDMLPGLLTTELCSLRSSEDHLAFSVMWEMDEQANIYDVQFGKSIIRSVASLTYDQAQAMLDNPNMSDRIHTSVLGLNKIAKILRNQRIQHGALTLASPEVRFKLDSETSDPTDVMIYNLKEANALVEEFMLLANITVSKKMLQHYPTLAILRRHQPPARDQFIPLLTAAKVAGIQLDIGNSKLLADSLDRAVRKEDPYFNKLIRILSTRCMMPAQYFCSGEIPKDQWHHYGLATAVYTHFTSPIRRYADILVHRLLAAAIGVIPLPAANAQRSKQQELCAHMNRRHRAAQYAQRASVDLYTILFVGTRVLIEEGYVTNITASHVSVIIPKYGIEERVEVNQYCVQHEVESVFHPDELSLSFTGKQQEEIKKQITILDKVNVEIKVIQDPQGEKCLQLMILN